MISGPVLIIKASWGGLHASQTFTEGHRALLETWVPQVA